MKNTLASLCALLALASASAGDGPPCLTPEEQQAMAKGLSGNMSSELSSKCSSQEDLAKMGLDYDFNTGTAIDFSCILSFCPNGTEAESGTLISMLPASSSATAPPAEGLDPLSPGEVVCLAFSKSTDGSQLMSLSYPLKMNDGDGTLNRTCPTSVDNLLIYITENEDVADDFGALTFPSKASKKEKSDSTALPCLSPSDQVSAGDPSFLKPCIKASELFPGVTTTFKGADLDDSYCYMSHCASNADGSSGTLIGRATKEIPASVFGTAVPVDTLSCIVYSTNEEDGKVASAAYPMAKPHYTPCPTSVRGYLDIAVAFSGFNGPITNAIDTWYVTGDITSNATSNTSTVNVISAKEV